MFLALTFLQSGACVSSAKENGKERVQKNGKVTAFLKVFLSEHEESFGEAKMPIYIIHSTRKSTTSSGNLTPYRGKQRVIM